MNTFHYQDEKKNEDGLYDEKDYKDCKEDYGFSENNYMEVDNNEPLPKYERGMRWFDPEPEHMRVDDAYYMDHWPLTGLPTQLTTFSDVSAPAPVVMFVPMPMADTQVPGVIDLTELSDEADVVNGNWSPDYLASGDTTETDSEADQKTLEQVQDEIWKDSLINCPGGGNQWLRFPAWRRERNPWLSLPDFMVDSSIRAPETDEWGYPEGILGEYHWVYHLTEEQLQTWVSRLAQICIHGVVDMSVEESEIYDTVYDLYFAVFKFANNPVKIADRKMIRERKEYQEKFFEMD